MIELWLFGPNMLDSLPGFSRKIKQQPEKEAGNRRLYLWVHLSRQSRAGVGRLPDLSHGRQQHGDTCLGSWGTGLPELGFPSDTPNLLLTQGRWKH